MKYSEHMLGIWHKASSDLQFKLIAPFELRTENGSIFCFALVPEFGSSKGMVVFTEFNSEHCRLAVSKGYGYSCISVSEDPYNRESFEAMLNDWGWSVEHQMAPSWYTGEP